jgi:multidrug efflux pump
MAIRLAAGANALDTGNRVKAKMDELSGFFPAGMKVVYPYDTTPFVKISIEEVVKTLIEAVFWSLSSCSSSCRTSALP